MKHKFKRFDRELEDFRSAVAEANLAARGAVERYVTMMDALSTAFTIYYINLPGKEKEAMTAAFERLRGAVSVFADDDADDNVHQLRKSPS